MTDNSNLKYIYCIFPKDSSDYLIWVSEFSKYIYAYGKKAIIVHADDHDQSFMTLDTVMACKDKLMPIDLHSMLLDSHIKCPVISATIDSINARQVDTLHNQFDVAIVYSKINQIKSIHAPSIFLLNQKNKQQQQQITDFLNRFVGNIRTYPMGFACLDSDFHEETIIAKHICLPSFGDAMNYEMIWYRLMPSVYLEDELCNQLINKDTPKVDEKKVKYILNAIQKNSEQILQSQMSEKLSEHIQYEISQSKLAIYSTAEANQIKKRVLDEINGYGPLQSLIDDDTITEIMVNSYNDVFIERQGKIEKSGISFWEASHLVQFIDRIVSCANRRIDEFSPMVDIRMPDGYRVNIIIPPIAIHSPALTIRKFFPKPYALSDLVQAGSMDNQIADQLSSFIKEKKNIIVAGGTGAGKSTLLSALLSEVPDDERIVVIEDSAELKLNNFHVIRLESRPQNIEGQGEINIRDLLKNALRMRPNRIVIGECRGDETMDMLQAMNTGHQGSLTTIHANSSRDALARLETMILMAVKNLPLRAIREQIASAVDYIVHVERDKSGKRQLSEIAKVTRLEGDMICLHPIYCFHEKGCL